MRAPKKTYLQNFNADEFHQLYREMQSNLNVMSEKEVVAFVGLTGAGKSTSLNCLLGYELESFYDDGLSKKYRVKPSETKSPNRSADIGHDGSETLFPAVYDVADKPFALLDTAGLGDTRGKNVSLCISLALKQISEVAKIKGIVVVLRQENFTEPRARTMRELFKLVAQLTSEFNSTTIAFCVTGLSESNRDSASFKAALLRTAHHAAQTMKAELNSDDNVERKKEVDDTIAALSLMNADNLFLMANIDQIDNQRALQETFFSFVEKMPGLPNGLQLAMDEITAASLLNWSGGLAQQGLAQLQAMQTINAHFNDITEKQKQIALFNATLSESNARCVSVDAELQRVYAKIETLAAEQTLLIQQQEKFIAIPHETVIPLPKTGGGVAGLIAHRDRRDVGHRFEHVEPRATVQVISQNPAKGAFEIALQREVTDHEIERHVSSGVTVVAFQKQLQSYQLHLQTLVRELTSLNERKHELMRAKKNQDQQLLQIKMEIQHAAERLEINVRQEDTNNQLLLILQKRADQLATQLISIQVEKTKIESSVQCSQKEYDFLTEVIKRTELDKKEPVLHDFMTRYSTSGLGQMQHDQSRADNVTSLIGARNRLFTADVGLRAVGATAVCAM